MKLSIIALILVAVFLAGAVFAQGTQSSVTAVGAPASAGSVPSGAGSYIPSPAGNASASPGSGPASAGGYTATNPGSPASAGGAPVSAGSYTSSPAVVPDIGYVVLDVGKVTPPSPGGI
jgi:hypothetical protein